MTAQPVSRDDPPRLWTFNPAHQRTAAFTIEDVLNLPDDAPRVELDDGVMVAVPSPTFGHQRIGIRLSTWFDCHCPPHFLAGTAVGVMVTAKDTYEPDVILAYNDPGSEIDLAKHYVMPEQVAIAVEVVSPGTRKRDRFTKPGGYAAAGIRYYWRIEQDPVHIFAYKLGENGAYDLVADSAELLELSEPFAIKLVVAEIAP